MTCRVCISLIHKKISYCPYIQTFGEVLDFKVTKHRILLNALLMLFYDLCLCRHSILQSYTSLLSSQPRCHTFPFFFNILQHSALSTSHTPNPRDPFRHFLTILFDFYWKTCIRCHRLALFYPSFTKYDLLIPKGLKLALTFSQFPAGTS